MKINAVQNYNYAQKNNNKLNQNKDKMNFGMIKLAPDYAMLLSTCRTKKCILDFINQVNAELAKKINLNKFLYDGYTTDVSKQAVKSVIDAFGAEAEDFDMQINESSINLSTDDGNFSFEYSSGDIGILPLIEFEHKLPDNKIYKDTIDKTLCFKFANGSKPGLLSSNAYFPEYYDEFAKFFIMPFNKKEYTKIFNAILVSLNPLGGRVIPMFPKVELLQEHLKRCFKPLIREKIASSNIQKDKQEAVSLFGKEHIA